jgi:hypothetical protein
VAPFLIVLAVLVVVGLAGYRYGADSRPGADAPLERWLARPYDD